MNPARKAALKWFADNPDAKFGIFNWHKDLAESVEASMPTEQMRSRMKSAGEVEQNNASWVLTDLGRRRLYGEDG